MAKGLVIRNLPDEVLEWCREKAQSENLPYAGAETYVRQLLLTLYELDTGTEVGPDPVPQQNKHCSYDPDTCPDCSYFPCSFPKCPGPLIQTRLPLN